MGERRFFGKKLHIIDVVEVGGEGNEEKVPALLFLKGHRHLVDTLGVGEIMARCFVSEELLGERSRGFDRLFFLHDIIIKGREAIRKPQGKDRFPIRLWRFISSSSPAFALS